MSEVHIPNSDWASASDWVFSSPNQYESNAGSWNGLSAQAGSRKCNWSGQTVSQNLGVPAAANATYSLTFYVGRPNNQSQGTFRAELFDDAGSIIDSGTLNGPTTSPTWQKFTLTGVAGASGSGNLTVRFTSVNGGGNANWLDNVSLGYGTLPASPSGLSATTASASQINLIWTDNASDEDGYKIEHAPDVAGSPGTWVQVGTAGLNATNFNSTGLSGATKYYYRVAAYNGVGDSGYSNIANATTKNDGFTWTGAADGSWVNVNNWLYNDAIPTRYPGNGNNGDVVYFGTKNGGASHPTSNQNIDDRVSSLKFQDAWEFDLAYRYLQIDGVNVDIPGTNGTARIYSSGLRRLLSPNSITFSAAAGDTLVLDCYFKPVGSSGNGYRTENFGGGGTVAVNNGFDNDNKTITYNVQGNTTLINGYYVNSLNGNTGSITVDAGSTVGGSGNFQVLTSTVNGTVSPSIGNANTGISTLTFSGALNINNGTYAAEVTAASCDKVAVTGALTLGANSRLVVSGTTQAKVYEIATYSSLTGTFNTSTSVLPENYKLDYAYGGANKIALVKQPGGTTVMIR